MFPKYRLSIISFLLMIAVTIPSPAPEIGPISRIPSEYKNVQVHALLIIPSNDPIIGKSVAEDSSKMQSLLRGAARNCEVHVTIIEADTVTQKRMLLRDVLDEQSSKQTEISITEQVTNWIRNLEPKATDTILVYYAGPGGITESGSHVLRFGPIESKDVMDRKELSDLLSQKPCRLKLLITDVDSSGPPVTEPLNPDDATLRITGGAYKIRLISALENLFLQHKGFLNLTAATEGESSLGTVAEGGIFTMILHDSIDNNLDLDGDAFLSWEEVFKLTRHRTILGSQQLMPLLDEQKGIESQRPKYYGELPKRIETKATDNKEKEGD